MRKFDQINVIPFIDIMLVLLAIVLTTATFIAQGKIEIELPEAESGAPVSEKPPHEIVITAERELFYQEERVELDTLETALAELPADQAIVLRVDAAAPFARFVAVVDVLKALGMDNLSIMTQEPQA